MRMQNRNQILFDRNIKPPSPHSKIPSTGLNQPEPAGSDLDYPTFGRIEPRLVTPVPAGDSFGPALTAWSKRMLNIDLMDCVYTFT